ncbi:MAG TPA: hypothetical protein PLZ46_00845 [Bacteroidales bacterium]|nr:hypothetical protein [Bacteroidales bacterium]
MLYYCSTKINRFWQVNVSTFRLGCVRRLGGKPARAEAAGDAAAKKRL